MEPEECAARWKSLLGTNLSGKVHLLEEVMVFSLSPPPAKYRTNPYTPFQFSFK